MNEKEAWINSNIIILLILIGIGIVSYLIFQHKKDIQEQINNNEKNKDTSELDFLLSKLENEKKNEIK